jgi:hypothetical protein
MSSQSKNQPAGAGVDALPQILRELHKLRYGALEIVVHDGRIVQIERREKIRIEAGTPVHSAR